MKRAIVPGAGGEFAYPLGVSSPRMSLIGWPRRTLDCRHGEAVLAVEPGARRREYPFLVRRAGRLVLRGSAMETLHRRCAGLDVHQKEIVACRRIVSGRKVRSELARFATTTQGLLALSAWLA